MHFIIVFVSALAVVSAGYVAPLVYSSQHLPIIGSDGVPINTLEVQQARAAHYAHKVDAQVRNGDIALLAQPAPIVAAPVIATRNYLIQADAYPTTAVQPTSVNGVPLETPEVVAAKANHFAAHAEVLARNSQVSAIHSRKRRGVLAPLAYTGAYTTPYYSSIYPAYNALVGTRYAYNYNYGPQYAYTAPYSQYYLSN